MKQGLLRVESNLPIAEEVYLMRLRGDVSAITTPGQFVNIRLDGFYSRRPISVCDYDGETVTIAYKLVGDGTRAMSVLAAGSELDVLTGLGNGFDTSKSGGAPLLIGGGIGSAPLYALCRKLLSEGKQPSAVLGFNSQKDMILTDMFTQLGVQVYISTVDGSAGVEGFVTDAMKGVPYTYFYACGPSRMFDAVNSIVTTSGQYSFESRMGCGFGACMSCSCMTRSGAKRVCKDGPVFEREEIIWED